MHASAEPPDGPLPGTDDQGERVEPELQPPPLDPRPAGFDALPREALVGALLLALGAALICFVVPPAGLVFIWPILFVVPGWLLVERVVPHLPAPGRVGLAVVASVYVSAHVVNVVSLAMGGFSRVSVLVAVGVLGVGSVAVLQVRHPWLAPIRRPTLGAALASARTDAGAWLVAGATGLTVLVILFGNGWRETPDGFVSGGWNWSDFLVHVAIGASIQHGNFPPEVPYFAGVPLTYHWFADFHGAVAATAGGIDLIPVYFLSSGLFAAVAALLIWTLALALTRRRTVATLAALLFCFGGGMGWIRLVSDILTTGLPATDLITNGSYDNTWADDWPFFRIASVLGTGFLPHRATTLGLPGLLAATLLAVTCIGRRPAGVLLAGVLAALLAPFHFYALPATYLIVGLFVLASGAWRRPTAARDAVLFLAPAVLTLPFIAGAVDQQRELGAFRPVLGWSEARFGDGPAAVAFFYLTNLGLPFVLALVSLLRGGTPFRAFLGLWVIALFLVPNLVVVSAVEFDMNKYFQMMWVGVAILAAWLVRRWPRPAIAAVVLFSAISPALVGLWHLRQPALALDRAQARAAGWIDANAPDRAVFVTSAFINSPVDLAGRLRISTFGPYAANLGYDPTQRERDTKAIYCDGPDEAARLMATYGATFVLAAGAPDCAAGRTDFGSSPRFERVYDADGIAIWRLAG